ncbi:hypothetical protein [Sphingobium boeckii]|uniref:Uncharacterized protein n=1 Tax=Sphingobium boeckii TaxID=1082345 RepID=A0A7W9AET2_9SPHN|nr:hypothetical protein [Sphingobium boeckii]MBB5684300.1 hypothetical protein [Sphingobium boeckii]
MDELLAKKAQLENDLAIFRHSLIQARSFANQEQRAEAVARCQKLVTDVEAEIEQVTAEIAALS